MCMPKIRVFVLRTVFFLLVAINLQTTSHAQVPTQRSTFKTSAPYQQRLSPYLNLLRSDNSLLGPYFSFVRPRQEIHRSLNRHTSQIGELERSIDTFRPAEESTSGSRLPTGRGGTFNTYLHYYPMTQRSLSQKR